MGQQMWAGVAFGVGACCLSVALIAAEPAAPPAAQAVAPLYRLAQKAPAMPFRVVGAPESLRLPQGTTGVHHQLPHLQLKSYTGAEDVSANVTVCADDDAIYFLFDVTDDIVYNEAPPETIWGGDKVEIYLAAGGKARQLIITPPSAGKVQQGAIRVWEKNHDIVGLKTAGFATEKGYVIQVAVPRTALAAQGVARLEDDTLRYSVDISDADSTFLAGVPHVPVKTDLIPFGDMSNYTLQNADKWATASFKPLPADATLAPMIAPAAQARSPTMQRRMKLTDPKAVTADDLTLWVSLLGKPDTTAADATYAMLGLAAATPKPEYVQAIAPYLKHENSDLRSTAATCLGNLELPQAEPMLRTAADDKVMGNRCNVLLALAKVGNAHTAAFLEAYLDRPNLHGYEVSTANQALDELEE